MAQLALQTEGVLVPGPCVCPKRLNGRDALR
jgi:hypothetical protein